MSSRPDVVLRSVLFDQCSNLDPERPSEGQVKLQEVKMPFEVPLAAPLKLKPNE